MAAIIKAFLKWIKTLLAIRADEEKIKREVSKGLKDMDFNGKKKNETIDDTVDYLNKRYDSPD